MNVGLCVAWFVAVACGSSSNTNANADGECSCPAGPAGPKGDVGPIGPPGMVGSAGPIGAKGDKGDVGATGAVGATGPAGPTGATGAQGPQGIQGPAGPAGSPGGIARNKLYTVQPGNQASLNYLQTVSIDTYCNNVNDTAIAGGITYVMKTPNLAEWTGWPIGVTTPNQTMGWHVEVRSNTSPNLIFYPWVMCVSP